GGNTCSPCTCQIAGRTPAQKRRARRPSRTSSEQEVEEVGSHCQFPGFENSCALVLFHLGLRRRLHFSVPVDSKPAPRPRHISRQRRRSRTMPDLDIGQGSAAVFMPFRTKPYTRAVY